MKRIFLCLVAALALSSCGDSDEIIFNGSQALVGFETATAAFPVIEDTDQFEVVVNVTNVTNFDRSFTVTFNEELSTAPVAGYTILNNTNLVIPAGSMEGSFMIKGNPDNLELTRSSLVFDLTISDDSNMVLSTTRSRLILEIYRTCPVDPTKFIGDYMIQQLTPNNPDDGVPVFNTQVVTLAAVAGNSQARVFSANYLEALGIGQGDANVGFQLICDQVVTNSGIVTNLACGGTPGITLGPGAVPGVVDLSDDSGFTLTLTEYVTDGGCNVPTYQVEFKLTKQ